MKVRSSHILANSLLVSVGKNILGGVFFVRMFVFVVFFSLYFPLPKTAGFYSVFCGFLWLLVLLKHKILFFN